MAESAANTIVGLPSEARSGPSNPANLPQRLQSILAVRGFLGLSSYSKERSFLRSLNNSNGDGPSQEEFLAFFTEQTTSDFWKIANPKVQAQELSEIIARFEQKKQYEAYREALKSELSPENNARLQSHIDKLGNVSDKVRMAAARGFVVGDLSEEYDVARRQSGIGRLGNLWHSTLGRKVAAPINRLFQPIASHMQAFQATAGAWGKVLGLSVAGGIAFWAAAALLFPVSAVGAVGAALCAVGGVAIASQMPGAFKKLGQVQAKAEAARMQRDETFAEKNKEYRLGKEFSQDNSLGKSMIVIEGIQEHHFAGKAHLNVATGQVMLPENMHLSYAGFATLAFDRKTEQLRITLDNPDGQTAEQNAQMIKDIVAACTGQDIKKSVVLGTPCNDFKGMKKALEADKETIFQNRLADLKNELPANMDKILTKALLSGTPQDSSGGIAQYAATAAQVLNVSAGNDQRVYDAFQEMATPELQKALAELTGKQDITVAAANPVTTAATAIMGNVIRDYDKLSPEKQKLALVNVALGGGVPEKLAAYGNTLATAAAIKLASLGVTEQQLQGVVKRAHNFDVSGAGDDTKNHGLDIAILQELGIERSVSTNNRGKQLKRFESGLMETARNILDIGSATSMPDSRAFQVVAAQRDVVNA